MFSEPVRTWYKDGREDGPVIGIWPGSNLHHLRVLRNPRWEDFSYEQLDKTKNRFYWFGNGMTLGEKALVDDRKFSLLHLISFADVLERFMVSGRQIRRRSTRYVFAHIYVVSLLNYACSGAAREWFSIVFLCIRCIFMTVTFCIHQVSIQLTILRV